MKLRSRSNRTDVTESVAPATEKSRWFWEHYDEAADQALAFLAAADVVVAGKELADVGCGDGILTLALLQKGRPARAVGFDVVPTDIVQLLASAAEHGVASSLPRELEFRRSEPTRLAAADDSFDIVTTWSAFEHVADPEPLLVDIARVLRPDGVLFLQLWPFYHSERGSHLWDWFAEGFHHLGREAEEVIAEMVASGARDPDWTRYMAREFYNLNRLTLNDLQRCLTAAGLTVIRLELMSHAVNLRPGLDRNYRLSDLGIAGVKLIAVPA